MHSKRLNRWTHPCLDPGPQTNEKLPGEALISVACHHLANRFRLRAHYAQESMRCSSGKCPRLQASTQAGLERKESNLQAGLKGLFYAIFSFLAGLILLFSNLLFLFKHAYVEASLGSLS